MAIYIQINPIGANLFTYTVLSHCYQWAILTGYPSGAMRVPPIPLLYADYITRADEMSRADEYHDMG